MKDRPASAPESRTRRRDRRGGSGWSARTWLSLGAALLLGAAVVGSPLACGAVHRPVVLPVLAITVALALVTTALAATGQYELRPWRALALPLAFLMLALAQILPMPAGLRALLDPAGSELLSLARLTGAQPMSLDPPETYLRFAHAAAALAVGAAALVLSSGRRLRFVATALVATGGLAALVVGLGHRAASEDKIYGLFRGGRGLPVGPFINPNHTGEFLELAAFAALAFAFARPTLTSQRMWKILAAVLAAAALSTLSRGSVLALGAGALTWFLLAPRSDEGEPFHRTRFAAALIGLLVMVGVALGFGAEKLAGSLMATGGENLTKVSVWLDSLKILRAHPAGIGLGAFGHVYPVYQTVPSLSWFQFVENQPLGILIEGGVPGALLMLGALVLTVLHYRKRARRDRVEASLAAGLVAVLAHNLTDFGLETPGVLLPFAAVLGTLFGRQTTVAEQPAPRRAAGTVGVFAAVAALAGIALLRAPSTRDFDRLLQPPLPANPRELVREASRAHPTDYVFALAEARLTPAVPASMSERLRLLNRTMILCPLCSAAHAEAARDLWRLGRRQQALVEWRLVLARSPQELWRAFGELASSGAKPAELATLANDRNRYELSNRLLEVGMVDAARQVLAEGSEHESIDFHLAGAQISLGAKDLPAARAAALRALDAAPRDPRAALMAAEIELRAGDKSKAVDYLTAGLRFEPGHVELNRKLLGLMMETDRWRAIDSALDGLRRALGESGAPMTEANLSAARIYERRGQYQRALAEYQAAAGLAPDDLGVQLALAQAAERSGSITVAIDTYAAILRRAPGHTEASAALGRIQKAKKSLEVRGASPFHTGADDR